MEEFKFINNRVGKKLYGVLHFPANRESKEVFVFSSPTFGEKTKSYRVLGNFARLLALNGYWVFRFDFMGEGDSEGDFKEASIRTRIEDLYSVIDYLQSEIKQQDIVYNIFGARLGATIASAFAREKLVKIGKLVMWDPVIDPAQYLLEFLRGNLSNQLLIHRKILLNREDLVNQIKSGLEVNVDGWIVGKELWEQAATMNLFVDLERITIPCFISLSLGLDKKLFGAEKNVHRSNFTLFNAPQEFTWSDWKNYNPSPEIIFDKTLNWINENK
ncbi:MAG TPA: alpha/beta hydrolase [Candidatus Omnitrophota bacterium]|nr:alpha/beta hydrolase [Candidatus Omnitrophota bacterium]